MQNKFTFCLFVFCILHSLPLFAKDKTYTLSFGLSGSELTVLDYGPSSNIYKGVVLGSNIRYVEETVNWRDQLCIEYQRGKLSRDTEQQEKPLINSFLMDWKRSWKITPQSKWNSQMGFLWHNAYTQSARKSFSDNRINYCFASSLSPYIRSGRQIHIANNFSPVFYGELSYALMGYVVRPSLTSKSPVSMGGEIATDFMGYILSGHISSVSKFQYIVTSLGMKFNLNQNIVLALEYNWNYLSYKRDNYYYEANQQFQTYVSFQLN